jgi:hypothetical protein
VADLTVRFVGDTSKLKGAVGQAEGILGRFQGKVKGIGKGVAGGVFGGALLTSGANALKNQIGSVFAEARESVKIGKLTDAVIKSTGGVAGVTAKQVGSLAEALSKKTGIDDEAIQSSSNLLLTFTNVRNEIGKGNDVFNRATGLVQDMSVALGQDGKSSAIQLGKALNDPIKGITALSRVGVSFTKQQKDQIKALVESGDTLGAQKIILKELGREFGGAAEAAADPMQKLGVTINNVKERLGLALLPIVNKLASFLDAKLIPAIKTVTEFFKRNKLALVAAAGAIIGALVPAFIAWASSAAAAAAATIAAAAPFIVIGAAIAALVYVIVKAYKENETFRNIVDTVGRALKSAALVVFEFGKTVIEWVGKAIEFVRENWKKILPLIGGPIGLAVTLVISHFTKIREFITTVWQNIQTIIQGALSVIRGIIQVFTGLIKGDWSQVWEGIKNIVSGVWQAIGAIVSNAITVVKTIFQAGVDGIKAIFSGAATWLVQAGKDIVKGLYDGIVNAPYDIAQALRDKLPFGGDSGLQLPDITIKNPFRNPFGGNPFGASGGKIPGHKGQPFPMIAHGGELILNDNQNRRIVSALAAGQSFPVSGARGGASGVGRPIYVVVEVDDSGHASVKALQNYQRTNGAIPIRVAG